MDRHADTRDRQRHDARYGHQTTNPGLRMVLRDRALAARLGLPVEPLGPNDLASFPEKNLAIRPKKKNRRR
jgi:hypothetical protein